MARLVIEHLAKSFPVPAGAGVRALTDLNLAAASGELLVLAGPSGCGKTTTLRLIAGLETPDEGKILVDAQDVTRLPPHERNVAMVFQNHALYPHLTVRENLGFGLKLRKVPAAELARRIEPTAATLGLRDCLERLPETLSGGQRQRVALGRAMVQEPKLFLLDEPLANLDAPMRAQLRREIAGWQRQSGATMIYVTHDQAEALALAGRLAVMRDGVLQQIAPPREIYERPANRFVAGFIGSPAMNFIAGKIVRQDGTIYFLEQGGTDGANGFLLPVSSLAENKLATWVDKKIILGIRPHDMDVTPGATASTAINARVEAVEPAGAETYLYVRTQYHLLVARVAADATVAAAESIGIMPNMTRAHFFDPVTELAI